MKHTLTRALAPLGLALALTLPAAAAGMSSFVPKVEYTPFSDVAANAWYAADVEKAVELGLMSPPAAPSGIRTPWITPWKTA